MEWCCVRTTRKEHPAAAHLRLQAVLQALLKLRGVSLSVVAIKVQGYLFACNFS